jgi:putative salt-induced outer membrane protein YdiY
LYSPSSLPQRTLSTFGSLHLPRAWQFYHWLVIALIALTPLSTWAGEVLTRNGDRLTGDIVTMEDNILTLDTEYGEMKIDWGKVVQVTSIKPMKVRVLGEKKGFFSDFFLGGHEFRHVTELREGGPIPVSEVKGINIGHIKHDGTVTIGGNHTTGNTNTKAVNAVSRVTIQAHRQRLYLEGKYNYGEANGAVTARNWAGQLKYDYFLTEKFFLNTSNMIEHDRFQNLQLRTTLGAGVGYQLLNTGQASLSSTVGLAYVDEDFTTVPETETPSTHLGYRLEFTLFSRLKFFQRFDGYYDLRYGNAIRITMDQGVRIPIYQTLYVSLEYDYRLNTQPAPDRVKVDDSYIFGVGFEF